ncbi:MAG TPA: 50S ribosomal protein L33 [Firmicutes bacterium]|nr:50S ribosomal protein L33 [Bacillota bacterium]
MPAEIVILLCEICKKKNYTTMRNKKTNKEKLNLKKYCNKCRKHTLHKESK